MLTLSRSRSWSLMLAVAGMVGTAMLLVVLGMGGAEEAGLIGAGGTAPLARGGLTRPLPARQIVAGMSSRFSSTYRLADGTLTTHVSSTPVNFRDTHGRWRAIDPTLIARGDAFANRAGAHGVSLPRRLSQGIHVKAGRDRLSMRLLGADSAVSVRGAQARYRDVLPGVSAIYDSQATGLRERLVLANRTAPTRFVFSLNVSRGLHPRQQGNGNVVFSRAGRTVFVLPAPFAYAQGKEDETHGVSSVLRRRHGGWTLTVAADRGWVHDALGRGPVVIDPTVEIDPDSQDCFIESDTPTTNYCSDPNLSVGYDGVNDQRGLVQFDLSALPKDAVILNADFGLTLGGHSTNNTKHVGVYRVLQPWTNSATWNKYDATHSWAAPGAASSTDASSSPAATVTTGTGSGFVDWYPTKLVQDWVSGALPNYGLLIRDVNPNTTTNELNFNQHTSTSGVTPELDIVWSERTGVSDNYDFDGQALDGKTGIAVNVANGNLFVDTRGLSVPGNGLDLELQNYHNSLASPTDLQGEGIRGTASLGGDVRLKVFDPTTVAFFRGDGLNASFLSPTVSGTTASYITPPEFGNATLTRDTSTNVYTLNLPDGAPAWPDANLTMTFASSGKLTSVKDAAGHAISLSYFSGGGQELPALSGITDTNGANFTLDPNPAGDSYISSVTDPAGHHWSYVYGHDNTDYLTTYTAGDTGQTWHYDYDSSHRLTSVTTPDGKVTKITYVGTTSKAASVMLTTDAAHTIGPTTTYAYSEPSAPCDPANGDIGKTVVTPPGGPPVTYCHDASDKITSVYNMDDAPLEMRRDTLTGAATISWSTSGDRDYGDALANAFRYRLAGGAWSAWSSDTDDMTILGTQPGQQYEVQVNSDDGTSSTHLAAATLTVPTDDAFTATELNAFNTHRLTAAELSKPADFTGYDKDLGDGDTGGLGPALPTSAASGPPPASGFGERTNYAVSCTTARVAGATPQGCPIPEARDPRKKTARKEEELRCDEEYEDELKRRRQQELCSYVDDGGTRRPTIEWNSVYRIIDPDDSTRVVYVGITKRAVSQRCHEHGVPITDPHDRCQLLMTVPNRGVALAVEQFLMETYGFGPGSTTGLRQNINYDTSTTRTEGWFNGRQSTLRNRTRNFSAKRFRSLYCAAIRTGFYAINLYLPAGRSLSGTDLYAHRDPPGTKMWWSNFPARDCFDITQLQNAFVQAEGRQPAHPR